MSFSQLTACCAWNRLHRPNNSDCTDRKIIYLATALTKKIKQTNFPTLRKLKKNELSSVENQKTNERFPAYGLLRLKHTVPQASQGGVDMNVRVTGCVETLFVTSNIYKLWPFPSLRGVDKNVRVTGQSLVSLVLRLHRPTYAINIYFFLFPAPTSHLCHTVDLQASYFWPLLRHTCPLKFWLRAIPHRCWTVLHAPCRSSLYFCYRSLSLQLITTTNNINSSRLIWSYATIRVFYTPPKAQIMNTLEPTTTAAVDFTKTVVTVKMCGAIFIYYVALRYYN